MRAARGMRGAPLGPCLTLGPAPFPWAPRRSPQPVRRCCPGCAGPPLPGACGQHSRRPPGCSRCRAWSHPGSSPALRRSAERCVRPRAQPRAAPCPRGRVWGVAPGTSLPRCSGHASTRGRGQAPCLPAVWVLLARCPRGALGSSPGRSPHPRPPGGGSLLPLRSFSALMTSCAGSSVGDRGRVLLWAEASATVVSLCLRAGDGVRTSSGCPVSRCCGRCRARGGVWVRKLERWLHRPVPSVAPRTPLGICLPMGASSAPTVARVSRARVVWARGPRSARSCEPSSRAVGVAGGCPWWGALRSCDRARALGP